MSIAFPALMAFLLSLPGICMRFGYKSGVEEQIIGGTGLTEEIAWGIIPSIFIHLIGILSLHCLSHYFPSYFFPANISVVLNLLGSTGATLDTAIGNVSSNCGHICAYFFITSYFGFVIGELSHRYIVREYNLDFFYPFLRLGPSWRFIFQGYYAIAQNMNAQRLVVKILNFRRFRNQGGVTCFVTALSEIGGVTFIYGGIYYSHSITKTGDLDLIMLESAYRQELTDKAVDPIQFYADGLSEAKINISRVESKFVSPSIIVDSSGQLSIASSVPPLSPKPVRLGGEHFIIPNSTIKNLNFDFLFVTFEPVNPVVPAIPVTSKITLIGKLAKWSQTPNEGLLTAIFRWLRKLV